MEFVVSSLRDDSLFLGITIGITILISWLVWTKIRKTEKGRRYSVNRRTSFESLKTETPLDEPVKEARLRASANITNRYRILRFSVVGVIVVISGTLITVPYLDIVPAAYISLFIGTATVVIGVAAKPFVENLISGFVISLAKPIRLGDTVLIEEHYGTVEEITLTYTIIKIWDWRRYIVPNHVLLQKEFINLSMVDKYQWAYVEFWVASDEDIESVEKLALESAKQSQYYQDFEDPAFWIMEKGKEATLCWVAAWANTPSDAWMLKHEIRRNISVKMRQQGMKTQIKNVHLNQDMASHH